MSRLPRYGVFFAACTAMTLLAVSVRKPAVDPAPSARPIHEWDISELAIQLNRLGVEVRLRAVAKTGRSHHSAYLTATAKQWRDLNALNKDPERIQEWEGTLYCERIGESTAAHLLEQWGEHCLAIGPFLFYGDAELLERVREVLAPYASSAAP